MARIYPLQRYEPQDWSGLTTENNLGALYGQEPILISNMIEQIYNVNLGDDLISYVNQFPVREIEDDLEYEWMLQGHDDKSIPLSEATDLAGNNLATTPTIRAGQNGGTFFMKFPEKYFFATHVIVGRKVDLYALRVVKDPIPVGAEWLYEVQLVTGDIDLFIPAEELAAGTEWSIDYSLSPQTLSDRGSDINFTSPFKMANRMSEMRKQHTVPGNMIMKGKNKPMAFSYMQDGQRRTTWLNYLDWEFWRQFRREKAKLLMYGKGNRRDDGTYGNLDENGYEVKAGMGLRDQISPANREYYNEFNLDHLVEFLFDQLSLAKLPEDQRRFVIGTGEYGFRMVSEAIERKAGAAAIDYNRMPQLMGSGKNTIRKQGGTYSFTRPQFSAYADFNGISFELMHIPQYDDFVRNKIKHPRGGVAESRRLTIMDFGTSSGEPNIQMVRQKGQPEIFRYIPGLRDPYSAGGTRMAPQPMANAVDGYEIHAMDICGIQVKNPRRLGEFIPNILV